MTEAAGEGVANPDRAPGVYPLPPGRLDALGEVYEQVVGVVGRERFQSAVSGLESGESIGSGWALDIMIGSLGEAEGGDAIGSLIAGLDDLRGRDVVGGGNPLTGVEAQVTHDLVLLDVATRPELQTPELLAQIADAERRGGMDEVARLVHDMDQYPDQQHGGDALIVLRNLVHQQENEIGLDAVSATAQTTSLGDD